MDVVHNLQFILLVTENQKGIQQLKQFLTF